MFRSTCLTLLCSGSLSFCAASEDATPAFPVQAPNFYTGQKITASTLHLLGAQLAPEVTDKLNAMRPALKALCRNQPQDGDQDLIAEMFEIEDTTKRCTGENKTIEFFSLLLKVSGFSNRLQSMLITKDIWPGQLFKKGDAYIVLHGNTYKSASEVLPALIPTYQTASRKIRYLHCDELIRQKSLKLVRVPETYLHLINADEGPHDENCVILEKKVSGKPLERSMLSAHFTKKHVREFFILIEGAGIWTLVKGDYDLANSEAGNWYIDDILRDENGVLYLVDLEQPNNSNPEHFFEPEAIEHHGNIKSGIEQLAVLCAHDPKKVALLHKLVAESKKINASDFSARFKREINSVLEQVSSTDIR